ncbi:MAG: hypothetical protein KKH01_07540 [Firmicutes bacterium]|nr:hypothetical protein [Bacillota bacterium]
MKKILFIILFFLIFTIVACTKDEELLPIATRAYELSGILADSNDRDQFTLLDKADQDGIIIIRSIDQPGYRLDITCGTNSGTLYPTDVRYFPVKIDDLIELTIETDQGETEYMISWEFIPYSNYSFDNLDYMLEVQSGNNVIGIGSPSYISYAKIIISTESVYSIHTIVYSSYELSAIGGVTYGLYSSDGTLVTGDPESMIEISLTEGTYYLQFEVPHDTQGVISFQFS